MSNLSIIWPKVILDKILDLGKDIGQFLRHSGIEFITTQLRLLVSLFMQLTTHHKESNRLIALAVRSLLSYIILNAVI